MQDDEDAATEAMVEELENRSPEEEDEKENTPIKQETVQTPPEG